MRRRSLCAIAMVALVPATAHAQHAITGVRTEIDFTGYLGTGLASTPVPGQLDSDEWLVTGLSDGNTTFGGTFITGDYARMVSTGGISTGGLYSFTVATADPAFGWQATGTAPSDLLPGSFTLRFVNQTGATITDPSLAYEVWIRNDSDRGSSVDLAWAVDAGSFTTIAGANVTSATTPDGLGFTATARSIVLAGATIPVGGILSIRWTTADAAGTTGGRDELALDDIVVSFPGCGDGDVVLPETCDDGGVDPDDGCAADCTLEHGFGCTGEPSTCASTCGDGVIASDEPCDDGDTAGGDGCDADCAVELGFECNGEPSVCADAGICGDGDVGGTEGCDDGGTAAGDGCSADCTPETGFSCAGEPSTCIADRDGDTVADDADNCPDMPNPSQGDVDEDGLGNACDELPDGNPEAGCCDTGGRGGAGAAFLAAMVLLVLTRARRKPR